MALAAPSRGFQCKEDARDYGGDFRVLTVNGKSGKFTITSLVVTENREGREREEIELLKDGTCTFAKGETFVGYCKSEDSEVSITKSATNVVTRSAKKTFIFSLKDCAAF